MFSEMGYKNKRDINLERPRDRPSKREQAGGRREEEGTGQNKLT